MHKLAVRICCLLAMGATGAIASDRSADAGLPAWRTTVHVAPWSPPAVERTPKARGQQIETGSLPPAVAVAPPKSLSGGPHALAGIASYYWQDQQTASGERFDKQAFTAAHRTLPFNTRVRVTHLGNGKSVVVRINDRGPFKPGRVIDLSYAAAGALGMHGQGVAQVRVDILN